jgi:hypothetical protein
MFSLNTPDFTAEWYKEIDGTFDGLSEAISGATRYGWEKIVAGQFSIDTGRSRASWGIFVDYEDFIELTPYPKGTKNAYGYPTMPNFKFDALKNEHIMLTNNVEYIENIEDGAKTVPANNMVKNAIPNIKRSLNVRLSAVQRRNR